MDEDDNVTSMMEAALEDAPKGMVTLVKRRDQDLKVRVPHAMAAWWRRSPVYRGL